MKATALKKLSAPPSGFLEKLRAYYDCFGRTFPGIRLDVPGALRERPAAGTRRLVIGGKVLMIRPQRKG